MSQQSNVPANSPAALSVEQNIVETKAYASTHSISETYHWFYLKVRNGGEWDFKQQGGQYEEFGNWHYGVIGAALGIPDEILLRMAGAAQLRAGTSQSAWGNPLGGAPYGDDPLDQAAIQRGIEWAKDNGHETSMLFPEHQINLPMTWDLEGWGSINTSVQTHFRASQLSASPLILDLDGDGIEITQHTGAITFDHDANGIETGTAWAGADDGLLVLDRDGNGNIDTGRELFGNNTLLANGQKAADGYAALRELDANADGVLDASDAAFANLRVWRDLDQDGNSDAGELFSLNEVG